MMSPKARLALAAGLFIAWIGWLVYVVLQSRDPVILSRPQFLVADLYVTALLTADGDAPSETVTIADVLWAAGREKPDEAKQIKVAKLSKCALKQGWQGEGVYLLPLSETKQSHIYNLTSIPPSPGYGAKEPENLRIYLDTEDARRQVNAMIAAKTR
jgi:hypothetical protein